MANTIKPKRSNVAGNTPTTTNLISGEMGVNMADQKIWINNGTTVVQIGAGKLSAQSDVAALNPEVKDSLVWDGSKWINASLAGDSIAYAIALG